MPAFQASDMILQALGALIIVEWMNEWERILCKSVVRKVNLFVLNTVAGMG